MGSLPLKTQTKNVDSGHCMMVEISRNSFFNSRHLFLFLSLLATSFSNINIDTDIIFITTVNFTAFYNHTSPWHTVTAQSQWIVWAISWFYPVKTTYGIDYFWVVNIWPTFLFLNLRIKERFHDTKSINKEIKIGLCIVYIDNSLVYIQLYEMYSSLTYLYFISQFKKILFNTNTGLITG